MTDINELKVAIRNELSARLPEAIPGLTKSAYEQIISEAVEAMPKNVELFEQFEKSAGVEDLSSVFTRGIVGGLGGAAAAAIAGTAISGIRGAFKSVQNSGLRPAFEEALRLCLKDTGTSGEILRSAPQSRVRSYAETIFGIAPHVASDPNLLKGVLASAVQGESIDISTTRSLMELEEKRKNLGTFKPMDIAFKG